MSISLSSSKGVPSNKIAGGKKSDSDGGVNSAARLVTLSGLSRVRAADAKRLRFDRTLTIYQVDDIGSRSSAAEAWSSLASVCRVSATHVDSVTLRTRL
ncbi:MAG: hypothetical protein WBD41_01760 [Rhodococcus sp. (in: high G+C Gram-positive bacteria)]|uniref:hypothetical protein n=1 Tax=Rhodococcus sp. EPR-157 TaxID=1813677 RepID=UPI001E5B6FEA|nr:hypothetical protein [Rhodococcus sp. EPR-157]